MLSRRFVSRLRGATAADPEALETELGAVLERARAAWHDVSLDTETFLEELAARIPSDGDALDGLRALRSDAIYLAGACARGDAVAIAAFEQSYFREIDAALAQLRASSLADEIKQQLRERLFTAAADRRPRISEYAGRGDLGRWLRAVATRAALDALRRSGREVSTGDDALAERGLADDDPELAVVKARCAADFKSALREALTELDPDARSDLRMYYLDGLTLDEMAGLHHVATVTVWRRLGRARTATLRATRRILRERLGLDEHDVESVLALIESRFELPRSVLDDH